MDTRTYRSLASWGISLSVVAALSFGAGIALGNANSAAAVMARVPFLGDGLSATPDTSVDMDPFWKAWNTLRAKYVLTHASSTLPTNKELIYGAIEGLADAYGDPYTVYMPPKDAEAFAQNIAGSFGGVGLEIDVKDGVLTVITPLKGTPGELAGILAGDQIVGIDKKSTDGLSLEAAVSRIRGEIGSVVELSIMRSGKLLTIPVTRASIQVPQTEDGLDSATGVYHIALYEFTETSVNLFNEALSRFKASGSKSLVLDLRGNPGGYLEAAVNIASHFLPKGTKVVTEDFDGKQENRVHTSLGFHTLPSGTKVVVLIDKGSASASEILAGALQDARVATVIGTTSFGKGSVQELVPLAGGSLKITIARWVTPAGKWIMGNGVTPDIIVPVTAKDLETKTDPQMARALQFLTTGR